MTVPALPGLGSLRRRLIAWYAATLGCIVLLLGAGLYLAIHSQLSQQLDASLRNATNELQQAARIREMEASGAHGTIVDAVDELHIPDRTLFLFDGRGMLVKPDTASAEVRITAAAARTAGASTRDVEIADGRMLSMHGERFALPSGELMIAVVTADQEELADRYAALIAAFGGAALAAIVLVSVGGYFLVRQSTAPVEHSLASMRRFMADAAHELRTPIAVLRARADVALQDPAPGDTHLAALRGVSAESRRLGRTVDDLLLLAQADAGERVLERERVFLDDLAIDAASSVAALANTAGVTLLVNEFEATPVDGDARLLRELLVILLDNAVKFTPSGGTVHVAIRPDPQPTAVVEDSGPGVEPGQLGMIFDRFYRGDPSRPRSGGAGLGLSIAQWIVHEHRGRLAITNRSEGGARAEVLLPPPTAG